MELDFKTDVELSRLDALLRLNNRLDEQRERAEALQQRFGERPRTWYEFRHGIASKDYMPSPGSSIISVVVGVALGAMAAKASRDILPRDWGISNAVGAMTGGTVGFAYNRMHNTRQELSGITRCVDSYESYLNAFQQAKQLNLPTEGLDQNHAWENFLKEHPMAPETGQHTHR